MQSCNNQKPILRVRVDKEALMLVLLVGRMRQVGISLVGLVGVGTDPAAQLQIIAPKRFSQETLLDGQQMGSISGVPWLRNLEVGYKRDEIPRDRGLIFWSCQKT